MFIRNKTPFRVVLARGRLTGQGSIGSAVVHVAYRWANDTLVRSEAPVLPRRTDPPDVAEHPLWLGTSVTAAGGVFGNGTPHRRLVTFTVGQAARQLSVFGHRYWQRDRSGVLRASTAEPFERLDLTFARAFGGCFERPPGLDPVSGLPSPGGRFGYVLNRGGVGYYPDEAAAEGAALPNFELADQLVQQWSDRPTPGCFVPCPDLHALRAEAATASYAGTPEALVTGALRGLHHAPNYLIFESLPAGTPIALEGLERCAIRFDLPHAPARVRLRLGARTREVEPSLRSVHIDAEQAIVSCAWGYSFLYEEGRAPSWILVET